VKTSFPLSRDDLENYLRALDKPAPQIFSAEVQDMNAPYTPEPSKIGVFQATNAPYTPEFAQTGVFQADGHPDMTVRLIADGRGIGMSVDYGDGAGPHITEFPDTANRLQLAKPCSSLPTRSAAPCRAA